MQPHSHSSPRNSEAWGSDDDKPKKRAKKKAADKKLPKAAAAKRKAAATTKAATKTKAKAKAKAATRKSLRSATVSASVVAEFLAQLEDKSVARQILASLASRSGSDELAETPGTAALRRELADSKRRLDELEQKLAELANLVATLSAARSVPGFETVAEIEEDPCLRWLGVPSIEQYVGQHVALHATRGVIAHADSVAAVIASVRAQGLSLDDVCLATVPALPF